MKIKVALVSIAILLFTASAAAPEQDRIQPYAKNPRYWQYKGQPVVLTGGSREDNLFQIPDLKEHLDLLASLGGNYVRNTMSSRDPGDVQPFAQNADGLYDLERWNDDYWRRFENLLRWTHERDIIVQIEVWDRFDYSRDEWKAQAFNPKNNVNYTYEQAGFAPEYPDHPGANKQPFFFTTPRQRNNQVVLKFQQRFVDEMLRRSLPYPNVLYCMDNETSGDELWGAFWAEYIRSRAREAKHPVYLTEMWDEWNLQAPQHRRTFDHADRYDFVDISQNNHQKNDTHWNNFQWVYHYIASKPRPINTVKTYGADTGRYGTNQDGLERWWRHLVGGAAAVRFHRPDSGVGLNEVAQQHIRSARLFLKEFDLLNAIPDTRHELLEDRGEDEAYSTVSGQTVAIYFPQGGEIRLKRPAQAGAFIKWLDITNSRWSEMGLSAGVDTRVKTPDNSHWLALISAGQ